MNEFTKGELLTIHLDMTIYANKASPLKESPVHKELRDKVQRMIDNYCEHEPDPEFTYKCYRCQAELEI